MITVLLEMILAGSGETFENGNYDGFSTTRGVKVGKAPFIQRETELIEAEYFLEEVGFEESLAGYQFKNVMQVSEDYGKGLFDNAWTDKWKGEPEQDVPTPLDCCKRYIRMVEECYAEMGKKPTNTTYRMMKEAVAEAEKESEESNERKR